MKNFSLKTRESSHRSSKRTKILRIFVVTLICVLCVFLFHTAIGKITALVTTPIFSFTDWVQNSMAPLPSYIRSRTELLDEIHALKTTISIQSGADATIALLQTENDSLKSLLGAQKEERIAAGVIAQPPRMPYDALLIDRGEDDGIHEGSVVYHVNDHAIGFVSKVFKGSALVTLYSSNGVTGTAYIFGPNTYVSMYGEGGGVIRLSVPQGITVLTGNVVVLPGLSAGILGLVSEVRSIPTEPEQLAFVTLSAPMQSIATVAVSERSIEPLTFEVAEERIHAWDYHALGIDIPEIMPTTTMMVGSTTSNVNSNQE